MCPWRSCFGSVQSSPYPSLAVLALFNLTELGSCSGLSHSISTSSLIQLPVLVSVSRAPICIIFFPNSPANTQADASEERLKSPLGVLGDSGEQRVPGQPGQLSSLSCQLQFSCGRVLILIGIMNHSQKLEASECR